MARIRALKIGFFQNEDLAALSPLHRLLFEGLWLLADRSGRLEDRPQRIRAELFPYEPALNVEPLLNDLATGARRMISRYVTGGHAYIQVVNFRKHQHPHPKEPDSVIPEECLGKSESRGITLPAVVAPLPASGEPGGSGDLGSGDLGDGNGSVGKTPHTRKERATVAPYSPDFLSLWILRPKGSKLRAFTAFKLARPDPALVSVMVTALTWQQAQPDARREGGRFLLDLERWIARRRWEDERPATVDPLAANDAVWGLLPTGTEGDDR